ncbi:glucan endo-1,3-beta-D-glucosidase [Mangrovimonas sp. CR14]|uniref:glucan endo-1,3-beta-D-glucosidase n=1 Tax=Mangrovimonas sp. CR14 TaxID=2706120 RepID=UPI0014238567|nr:glucan endo-1,3-beta-D-glucosidase [Mangrovimonas sp. CR14]NIK93526.1 glucan endo-1,3-beta-D-glucosidase [Mangrovimonas sp. CR14]
MKYLKYIYKVCLLSVLIVISGCEKDEYEFGEIVNPSNLTISAEIVGQDTDNPYGDGSGEVHFNASADNAITYKYIYNGSESMTPNGTKSYSFGVTGVHTYTVTVLAIGTAGVTSSATIDVEVLALYNPPADLITMLTADGTRTWRIKAETAGHFGVGPADETSPIWWAAAPYDKDGKGAYDDTWEFNVDGTFTHITNGTGYGQAGALDADFGVGGQTPNGDNEYENYPLENYSGNWTLSAPGGQETLSFSNLGYHGFYVGGDHSYQILSRSDNEMTMKTVGSDGNGWFVIFIAD